jgi:hypothetical protein
MTDQDNFRAKEPPWRHYVELPDRFAVARWSRDADVAEIARCILGTLKYEPHTADTTALQRALEGVINNKIAALSARACWLPRSRAW